MSILIHYADESFQHSRGLRRMNLAFGTDIRCSLAEILMGILLLLLVRQAADILCHLLVMCSEEVSV